MSDGTVRQPNRDFEHYPPGVRRVLEVAEAEAWALKAGYLGPEHLLLSLFQADDSTASVLLDTVGTLQEARKVVSQAGISSPRASLGPIGLTPSSRRVLQRAEAEQARLNHPSLEAKHILFGLLLEATPVEDVLAGLNTDTNRVKLRLRPLLDD